MKHGKDEFDQKYFGMFFKKYDQLELQFYTRWFLGWIKILDKFLPLKKGEGKQVLEIGCAIGAFSKILSERGFKVTATDISPFIIKRAKRLHKNINFSVSDIEKEIPDKKYDFIFAFEVLEHLENPRQALLNIKRALTKDGVLVFSTPEPTPRVLADPMHINVHTPKYWVSLGRSLKYKSVSYQPVAFIPYFYRYTSLLSIGFPIRLNLPFINNTCFYFFKK